MMVKNTKQPSTGSRLNRIFPMAFCRLLCLSLILCAVSPAVNAQGTSAGQALLDSATKRQLAGDTNGAIEDFQKILTLNKGAQGKCDISAVHYGLGSALWHKSDFEGAFAQFKEAHRKNPRRIESLYMMGVIEDHFGRGPGALGFYNAYVGSKIPGKYRAQAEERIKALKENINSTQQLPPPEQLKTIEKWRQTYDAALELQNKGSLDQAIAMYKMILATDKNHHMAEYALGTAYQEKNQLDLALACYEKAAKICPTEAAYSQGIKQIRQTIALKIMHIGFDKQAKNDLAGAIADYEKAIKICDDPSVRLNLGTAYQAAANFPKALENYQAAINLNPKLSQCLFNIATVYERTSRKDMAVDAYKRYLEAEPNGDYSHEASERLRELRTQ